MKRRILLTFVFASAIALLTVVTWSLSWYAIGVWRHPIWTSILTYIASIPYYMTFGPLLLMRRHGGVLDSATGAAVCAVAMYLLLGISACLRIRPDHHEEVTIHSEKLGGHFMRP